MRRGIILLAVAMMGLVACGDDALTEATPVEESSSTTDGQSASSEVATTGAGGTAEEPRPPGAAFIMNGETGPYVWALQSYLDCAGYGPIVVDGVFGDGTAAAVSTAQADQNLVPTGEPDEETFAWLSRACFDERVVSFAAGTTSAEVAGNAAPGDDDVLRIRVMAGQQMTVTVEGAVDLALQGADGTVLHRPDGSVAVTVEIPTTQDYHLRVSATAPASYLLTVTVPPVSATETTVATLDGIVLMADGLNAIAFGTESGDAMDQLTVLLGAPTADTDWLPKEFPEGECADTWRVVSWEFPAAGTMVGTTLHVMFHDRGFSNPAFGFYDYKLTELEEHSQTGGGALSTEDGLSAGDTYQEAVSLGYEVGGYEEIGHGSKDGIHFHIYSDSDDLEFGDGFVGSIEAGERNCYYEEL